MTARLRVLDLREPAADTAVSQGLLNLDARERTRALRFHRSDDRRRTIAGQWLARHALADVLQVDAADIQLTRDARGRLHGPTPADVSVAHSGPWVVAAATAAGRVGVDVEALERFTGLDLTAWLSPAERSTVLASAAPGAQAARHWVSKEAVAKLRGHGFLVDPRTIATAAADLQRDHIVLRVCQAPDAAHLLAVATRQ